MMKCSKINIVIRLVEKHLTRTHRELVFPKKTLDETGRNAVNQMQQSHKAYTYKLTKITVLLFSWVSLYYLEDKLIVIFQNAKSSLKYYQFLSLTIGGLLTTNTVISERVSMQDKIMHHKFQIPIQWTLWYPRLMTRHTNKLSSKNLLTVLFFFYVKYHGTGL